jgi:hypothetical protein
MKYYGPGGSPAACRRIRTLGFFSAMDKNAGENRKNAVYYVYYRPKSPLCFSITVPKLYPKGTAV